MLKIKRMRNKRYKNETFFTTNNFISSYNRTIKTNVISIYLLFPIARAPILLIPNLNKQKTAYL